MDNESSKKNTANDNDANEGSSESLSSDSHEGAPASPEQPRNETTKEDCIDDMEKNKAVVGKMFDASPQKSSSATSANRAMSQDCKCMKRKNKFYCYKLRQGAWVQASGIGYPSKEICEANNCLK